MTNNKNIKLIECPRDAMQGLSYFIPTDKKVRYINTLLKIGFDTIDLGSFVSPSSIPQMKDTREVIQKISLDGTATKLLVIVANMRGVDEALEMDEISYLGFPLSLSEIFQLRNTNRSITDAFALVEQMYNKCQAKKKDPVVYLSMAFGNPYGEVYEPDYIINFVEKLQAIGIKIINPSDTIGLSTPENIKYLFGTLYSAFPQIEFGAHLHCRAGDAKMKILAAYEAGCRRFDGALKGFGGCPMAEDVLVGNVPTEVIIEFFAACQMPTGIDPVLLKNALEATSEIFSE